MTTTSKWVFHVQLLSIAQGVEVISLLRFPTTPLLPPDAKTKVSLWSRGKIFQTQSKDIGEFLAVASEHRANEIKVVYKFVPYQIYGTDITINRVAGLLEISPTNSLWESAQGYETKGRKAESIRMTHQSREVGLRWHGVSRYPTLLESAIQLQSNAPADRIIDSLFELLPLSMSGVAASRVTLGCAELGEDIGLIGVLPNMLEALSPWPRTYELLADHFDDLHQILVGPMPLCKNVARALGEHVKHREVDSEAQNNLGLLLIPEKILADPNSKLAVEPFIVPRDASTAQTRELDPVLGEFKLGSNVFYTARRNRELIEQQMLPRLKVGWTFYHLVHPKYCLMLGIDPEDMLVNLGQEIGVQIDQKEIDRLFESFPADMTVDRRVWAAHKERWRKTGFSPQAVSFLNAKFFPNIH